MSSSLKNHVPILTIVNWTQYNFFKVFIFDLIFSFRLKVFEGIPAPYDKTKRMVIPSALRVLRLKPGRRYASVGRISREVGWKYGDIVDKLETKRKEKSAAYFEAKKKLNALKAKAEAGA